MSVQRRRLLISRRRTRTGILLVAAISFLAGMTDAVGLLVAGNFVSFMSGNTTRAAVAFADGKWGNAAILVGALLVFVAGNALGIVIAHGARRRTSRVLASVAVLLALSAIIGPDLYSLQFYAIVLAMGVINASVEHVEGLPIGLTYVTGAMSRFGRGIGALIIGQPRHDWSIQIVPWLGMMAGGITGAVVERAIGHPVVWVTCACAGTLAAVSYFIPPRLQHRLAHRPILTPARRRHP